MPGSDFVLTPRGYRHRSLVNTVRGGATVRRTGQSWSNLSALGEVLSTHVTDHALVGAAPPPPPPNGWVSYADWSNTSGTAVTLFDTTWTVPPPPAVDSGQLLYLFNALEDNPVTHILQPVLQWGVSPAPGSGQFWGVASWWVGREGDQAFVTELVRVEPGDVLTGRMTLDAQYGAGRFSYSSQFVGVPGTKLTAQNLPELTICTETLEVYGVTGTGDYPAIDRTAFTGIKLQAGAAAPPVAWTARGNYPPEIVSNSATAGQVDIVYPAQQELAALIGAG